MNTFSGFRPPNTPRVPAPNPVPSSSPAFGTPVHPVRSQPNIALNNNRLSNDTVAEAPIFNNVATNTSSRTTPILPILLPPATLRPIAFRTFTKKHSLTLTSSALQSLAAFIGKNCGATWRDEGLAELVLDEVARMWKRTEAKVIVDGEGSVLKGILKALEGSMSGGKIVIGRAGKLSRENSLTGTASPGELSRQDSFGMSSLDVDEAEDEEADKVGPRSWLKVVSAFEQPWMIYNSSKKHFERSKSTPTIFPPPAHKTELFKQRHHLIHQRVLRNESFQASSVHRPNQEQWSITPIANLLGRSGSGHLLLGLLTVAPTGTLAINDLTGSIHLDLSQATPIDDAETWLCPGMIVLVDGIYEEEFNSSGGSLGTHNGIGGTIGGRFIGFLVGAPRSETRAATLGIYELTGTSDLLNIGGGFGWVDFLGLGSERAVGPRMRKIEQKLLHERRHQHENSSKIVLIGEMNLDNAKTLEAFKKILTLYTNEASETAAPLSFVIFGNFVQHATMSGGPSNGSIEVKEYFDALASIMSDFPALLRSSTWVFVPGDNDPWPSAMSAGASVPLPRRHIPDLFTNRVRRAFAAANADAKNSGLSVQTPGEAIWTSNPSRLTLFGPAHEMVLFRDDISGRFRRNALPLQPKQEPAGHANNTQNGKLDGPAQAEEATSMEVEITAENSTSAMAAPKSGDAQLPARRLTKTILDQGHLSPFALNTRPLHWDFAHTLSIYPLPTTLVLCDAEEEAFVLGYQGCCVINVGRVVEFGLSRGRGRGRWIEYDVLEKKGSIREIPS